MDQIEFYRTLKEYCTWKSKDPNVNCEDCCLRLYCYTPPWRAPKRLCKRE